MTCQEIFERLFDEHTSDSERKDLISMLKEHPEYWDEYFNEQEWNSFDYTFLRENLSDEIWHSISTSIFKKKVAKIISLKRLAVAASILLVFTCGWFLVRHYFTLPNSIQQNIVYANDVLPGGNKAILSLSDGTTVNLDSLQTGVLKTDEDVQLTKTGDGNLTYSSDNTEVVYHTVSTPRGGQFHLVLEDGTEVWLNAASSIRFPTAFKGNERKVAITGEVYFDVAKNKSKPFKVVQNNVVVEVLGTQFNMNGYNDYGVQKTTLVEGSIKISSDIINELLQPNQQIQVSETGTMKKILNPDMVKILAWRSNIFYFKKASIAEVMKTIERWYNVEVVVEGKMPDVYFNGEVSRNMTLANLLRVLNYDGAISCTIDGNKLIVKKANK